MLRPLTPFLVLLACAPHAVQLPQDLADAGCGCTDFRGPVQVGRTSHELNELSGLVASRSQPGVFWAHNDSGDLPRFFAMALDGRVLQTFPVHHATHVDWEDLGLGPCPSGTCLVLGDIGDNDRVRSDVVLYRVPEPTVGQAVSVDAEAFRFTYPDGPHNAEALFVLPDGSAAWIITKELAGPSQVFQVSFDAPVQVAKSLAVLPFPSGSDAPVTGADLSPCGDLIAVRLYNRLYTLRAPAGEPLEAALRQVPVSLTAATEVQSEAVAFTADGRALVTSSEQTLGEPVPIWKANCR